MSNVQTFLCYFPIIIVFPLACYSYQLQIYIPNLLLLFFPIFLYSHIITLLFTIETWDKHGKKAIKTTDTHPARLPG